MKKAHRDIDSLIRLFSQVTHGDGGFHPAMSGSQVFFPLDEGDHEHPAVWGMTDSTEETLYTPPQSFAPLTALVKIGPDAIPYILRHLTDNTPTQYTIEHKFGMGGIVYLDRYDYNKATIKDTLFLQKVNTRDVFSAFVSRHGQRSVSLDTLSHRKYTLTVGDICFVALGQIVNREFFPVYYQPSAIYCITSPVLVHELVKACEYEWGGLTAKKHKTSLLDDLQHPDRYGRDLGAYKRLRYYYPEEIEKLKSGKYKALVDSLEQEWKKPGDF